MAQFLQQNWLWVILIGAMLAMHLGGHRHGGKSGHGVATHGGCGGHAEHGTSGREEHRDHGSTAPGQGPSDPSRTSAGPPSARDFS